MLSLAVRGVAEISVTFHERGTDGSRLSCSIEHAELEGGDEIPQGNSLPIHIHGYVFKCLFRAIGTRLSL